MSWNDQLVHHLTEGPGSPLQPTQYGKKLVVDSGLEMILDEKKAFLKIELAKRLSQHPTEYDVQEKARALLLDLKENEMMNPIKKYAYQNAINLDVILQTGGLWLRDDFLGQERKSLPE